MEKYASIGYVARHTNGTDVDGKSYQGCDRHNEEIAAFQLDRILGFYRTSPTVETY